MKQFIKTKENFVCKNCKTKVIGNGYTNHCPKCLFSLHVDINPGDRAETCRGLMEPINFELRKGNYILTHKCLACGKIKRNKLLSEDNLNVLTMLSESIAKQTIFWYIIVAVFKRIFCGQTINLILGRLAQLVRASRWPSGRPKIQIYVLCIHSKKHHKRYFVCRFN